MGRRDISAAAAGGRLSICVLGLLLASLPATAATEPNQAERQRAVDALFADLDHHGSPGVAVAIAQHGTLLYSRGFGYADLENDVRVTPGTVFHVASVSKQFTAFAIALLARDGKVDLDADVRRYLPWVPDFGSRIAVRHLVHHTSGLRDQWALFRLGGQDIRNVLSQEQIVNLVARQRVLNFTPGKQFAYSNTGYTLLAEIVAEVTGTSLRTYADERIFRPLGMAHTFFYDDVTELVPARARSYTRDPGDGRWHRALLNFDNVGATSLHTTAEDLVKWGGNFRNPAVGDAALIDQVTAPGRLSDGTPIVYGFGLGRVEFAGHEAVMHLGQDAGFVSLFAWFPRSDLTIAVLMNNTERLVERAEGIVRAWLGPGTAAGDEPADVRAPPGLLQAMVGSYLNAYGQSVDIRLEEGSLTWRTLAGGDLPMQMGADGSFNTGDPTMRRYRPRLDATGDVRDIETLILGVPNDPAGYRRVPPAQEVSAKQLAEVAGDYRSEELDITYTLAVDNGRLTARSLWTRTPIELVPVAPDRYDSEHWWMATIVVDRGADGTPAGLRIHSAGAHNIVLRRIPDTTGAR